MAESKQAATATEDHKTTDLDQLVTVSHDGSASPSPSSSSSSTASSVLALPTSAKNLELTSTTRASCKELEEDIITVKYLPLAACQVSLDCDRNTGKLAARKHTFVVGQPQ